MNKVIIITDSTCDLPEELIIKNNIKVLPLHVTFNDSVFDDTKESLPPSKMFEMVNDLGILPKTSGISAFEFEECFRKYIEEGYDIFYTGLSSNLSTTYSQSVLASKEFDEGRIYCLDSKNLSTGTGLLVLKACKYRDRGLTVKEIYDKVSKLVEHVKSQFVVKTMEYLYKGGRCSSLVNHIGKTVRLRPLIVVRDGKMRVGRLNIGLMSKAVTKMAETFIKDSKEIDTDHIFVTYSLEAEDSKEIVINIIKEALPSISSNTLIASNCGNVISSHCGPGCIGILYIMKGDLLDDDLEED